MGEGASLESGMGGKNIEGGVEKGKSISLTKVWNLVRTDAQEGRQMQAEKMGNSLYFDVSCGSPERAQNLVEQLRKLGLEPKLNGRSLVFSAEFDEEEIDKLSKTFVEIPGRDEESY